MPPGWMRGCVPRGCEHDERPDTYHLPAEILVDPPQSLFALYQGNGTPTSFFIDRRGRVAYSYAGQESYADFAAKIDKIL